MLVSFSPKNWMLKEMQVDCIAWAPWDGGPSREPSLGVTTRLSSEHLDYTGICLTKVVVEETHGQGSHTKRPRHRTHNENSVPLNIN